MTSSVVFVSCDNATTPQEVVKFMIGELPDVIERPGISVYPWHLSTKYYDVDIELCCLARKECQTSCFSDSVEGLVIFFDGAGKDLSEVDSWMPYVKDFNAEVKMLVCYKCKESGISFEKAQEWCLREKFELVEIDADIEEDEEFPETVGAIRIKQALSAHVWPNLKMKDTSKTKPCTSSNDSNLASYLSETLEEDNQGLDFDSLFSQFVSMKEKAASMPSEERKKFAEKVVTAYWNAIGGDSDELGDLSDDSSNADDLPVYDKL